MTDMIYTAAPYLSLSTGRRLVLQHSALNAVSQTRFESQLPPGEISDAMMRAYLPERRLEIVAAARTVLPAHFTDEEVLHLLYRDHGVDSQAWVIESFQAAVSAYRVALGPEAEAPLAIELPFELGSLRDVKVLGLQAATVDGPYEVTKAVLRPATKPFETAKIVLTADAVAMADSSVDEGDIRAAKATASANAVASAAEIIRKTTDPEHQFEGWTLFELTTRGVSYVSNNGIAVSEKPALRLFEQAARELLKAGWRPPVGAD